MQGIALGVNKKQLLAVAFLLPTKCHSLLRLPPRSDAQYSYYSTLSKASASISEKSRGCFVCRSDLALLHKAQECMLPELTGPYSTNQNSKSFCVLHLKAQGKPTGKRSCQLFPTLMLFTLPSHPLQAP